MTKKATSSSSSCESSPVHSSYENKPSFPHGDSTGDNRREGLRRERNVQSAKRSKDRLKNEHRWMEIQTLENEDRIRFLERRMDVLIAELERPPSQSRSPKPASHQCSLSTDRPSWFGAPFWTVFLIQPSTAYVCITTCWYCSDTGAQNLLPSWRKARWNILSWVFLCNSGHFVPVTKDSRGHNTSM